MIPASEGCRQRKGPSVLLGMTTAQLLEKENDPLTYRIIGCAMAVHRSLGPGLLESIYEECLNRELLAAGFKVARQPEVHVAYEGDLLHRTFRPDFVVDDEVVVEVKAVTTLLPVHTAQVLTYLKLSQIERGLLINFNCERLIEGVKRLILTRQVPAPTNSK